MNTEEALRQLGVREDTLSREEKDFLDENGYLPLPNLLSEDEVEALHVRLADLLREEGAQAGRELVESPMIKHPREAGAERLSDLVNKGADFEVCYTHPRVLAAIRHVLGPDFKLSSLNSRASLPGHGLQKLHTDYPEAVASGDYRVCNSIWLLDDFTERNGATRIVPGSHRWGMVPEEGMDDPEAPHPDEIQLLAPAGTVVIFNSHTWHGGTRNRTDRPRRAIHSYFCRRDQPQQIDQQRYIRPETLERLSPAAQVVLDVRGMAVHGHSND